jgi:hypothetical protein
VPAFTITIQGAGCAGETAGYDSTLMSVPGRWYVRLDGKPTLLAQQAARDMRAASEAGAANLGEVLHHADWVITSDPAEVRRIGMTHGCAECCAGTASALAYLRDNPGAEIAAGLLWWARQPADGT